MAEADPKRTQTAPPTGHPIGAKPTFRQFEGHPAAIAPIQLHVGW
jgi:hypothetical protein